MSRHSSIGLSALVVGTFAAQAFAAPADAASEPVAVPAPAVAPAPAERSAPAAPAIEAAPVVLQPSPALSAPAPQAAPVANSPAFDDTGVPDDGTLGAHQRHFWISGGARTTFVKGTGFDVFAGDDVLAQASFAFGRVLYADGPWSFGASVGWDYGSRSSDVRRAATSLEVHRFTLNPEARYHFMRRLYVFARLGAGGAVLASSLADPVTSRERTLHPVRFTFDTSVGAAFEVLGNKSGAARTARAWLLLDAGYLFTASSDLTYESAGGAPVRSAPIALGNLGVSGFTGRLSAAVTF